MIRNCMVVVMTVFIATHGISQDRSLQWGSLVKEGYKADHKFIGRDKATGTSYWIYSDHGTWFTSFDKKNNRIRNLEIDYTKTGLTHQPVFRDAIYIHNKIFLLVSAAGKIYFHQLDKNGKVVDKLIAVAHDGNEFYDAAFRYSPDSTQMMIFSHFLNAKTNDHSESFTFIDPANSNIISNRLIHALPGLELQHDWNFALRDLAIDNKGNIVFETQLMHRRIRLPQYWLIRANEDSVHEIYVPRGEMTIGNIELDTDKQGRLLFTGFFSITDNLRRTSKPGGLLFGHVDVKTATIPDLKIIEMNDELSVSHPITFKLNNELQTQLKDDGGVILLTEQVYVDPKNYAKSDNVHVVSLDSTGAIVYNVSVPTKQKIKLSLYTRYIDVISTSYFHVYNQATGDLSLVYNSNRRNLDSLWNPVASLSEAKHAVPVLATIRGDGEIKYEVIDRKQSAGILLDPNSSWSISSTQAIVVGDKDKNWNVGILTLGVERSNAFSENLSSKDFSITQSKTGVHYVKRDAKPEARRKFGSPKPLKKYSISSLPSPNLLFVGVSLGYSTTPKNNFGSWLSQNNITVPELKKPAVDFDGMLLVGIKHIALGFELGADARNAWYNTNVQPANLFFGFSVGYHNYFSKGRHFMLIGTAGISSTWVDFYGQPQGPANISNANDYTIFDDGSYLGLSAKFFKTTGWFVGGGIDIGFRYHYARKWKFDDTYSGSSWTNIDYLHIPHIQGFSFYINFPIGLAFDGRRQRG